ncbi:MAG: tol-pal system protein YbgF [Rhodospirillaceae bacterium]|nr:tol-pal system protein YbgF [Rhodospirillaceae bacterium]
MAQQKWLIVRVLCFVVLYFSANTASSQSNNDLLNRISRLESEMNDLNRHVFSEKRTIESPSSQNGIKTASEPLVVKSRRAVEITSHQSAAAQNIIKLQRLEALVRSLQGLSEELNNRIDKLVGDLDRRLAVLETDAPFKDKVIARQQAENPNAISVVSNQKKDKKSGVLGYLPDSVNKKTASNLDSTKVISSVPPQKENKKASLLPVGTPNERYKHAFQYLRKRDYKKAEAALLEFINAHGDDPLAANANYWLGKTFYTRGLYDKAAEIFITGYEKYSTSPKTADSLLGLGFSLVRLKRPEDACLAFGQLLNEFPQLASSTKKKAITESKRIGCEG